jgi:2-octaprenyl-6-methoxyphenol hydroxylase
MHDLILVGAGPVGGTLALALAGHGLDIVAIDARGRGEKPRGDRSLALSHGSRLTLERLGLWKALQATAGAVTPITTIDISQAGGFGMTRLAAAEHGIEALGYVVSFAALQGAIDAALARSDVDVRFGVTAKEVGSTPAQALVALAGETKGELASRLAIVADGAGTTVAGIRRTRRDYGQVALVASVWLDAPHEGVAYERFTPEGPMALLPEGDHYGLVWTMRPDEVAQKIGMPEDAFLSALSQRFGKRVTGFRRVERRRSFPLALERSDPIVATRVAVVGNAAQLLHPVAGQGLNLGLRDAWDLAQVVLDARREDLGTPAMLARYAARRARDRTAGIAFTHGLVRVFGNDLAFVRWPRGLALTALDLLPPVKRAFARTMVFGFR